MAHTLVGRVAIGLLALAALPASADPERARELAATVCAACHGADGNGPVPAFPRLAGLQREYIAKQLADYMNGRRRSEVMGPVVADLTAADVEPLAAHYSAQKPASGTVEDRALAETGRKIFVDGNPDTGVPACMGCHLEGGRGNPRFPRLAGQHREYTLQQMQQFHSGTRTNDRGRVMRALAERMSEAEMKAVAEYIAGL